jgi:excisionase family DNA binding protein
MLHGKPDCFVGLLRVEQVAERLAVARRTVWRWLSQGKLPPPLRLSKTCVRWRPEDIDAHLARLVQESRPG